ncbi:transporter substrate-binding domain-containing protein [Desulfovibrio sulfodismutans]|uniref:Transporter substrate-binding domain-containing protein n=1 Tax=Desulfolutivibrio sulfodismutans TaxID=63561 RepID=A0A7K3NGZ2_9BACT|nr:transporter substrate-binding domain-containing protein [Desulfolutivibrio sulfodismutans]NDY55471.1 transporter substrate-binding domain-containing protein [Desulfolutivibrio sulfodismutans]QLA12859.1 transporter substrate-binding domain-containing protein [Desulfolutivibrio sulfodismutans DSM 3696]
MRYIVALFLVFFTSCPVFAGATLDRVNRLGVVRCGVADWLPGFALQDENGVWSGMDVDFCRAMAAAALADPDKVSFLPLTSRARFTALLSKEVDLLARNTTWTIGRSAAFGVFFVGPIFFTSQAFMVRASDAAAGLAALNGARVAVIRGATHEKNLEDVAEKTGLTFEAVPFDSWEQALTALGSGDCRGATGDRITLMVGRLRGPGRPDDYVILPEYYSKEPISPVVRFDDPQWATLAQAVRAMLLAAEEYGLTQAAASRPEAQSLDARLLLGRADALSKQLGVAPGWAARVVSAVGNYGEVFERNLGAGSPFGLPRGFNRQWKDGGLMWAQPF